MSDLTSSIFWKDAAERAVKTFAQSLVASVGVGAVAPVWQLGWAEALGIALTATLLSVLTSVASIGAAQPGTPSAINYEIPQTRPVVEEEPELVPYGEG